MENEQCDVGVADNAVAVKNSILKTAYGFVVLFDPRHDFCLPELFKVAQTI